MTKPNHTAERTALWRALHLQVDALPHIMEDEIGLRMVAPGADWRHRPDMDPDATKRIRASMVARGRFVDDLVLEQAANGVTQYVLLGAGLDSFAVRYPAVSEGLQLFEIDQEDTLAWKQARLHELGYTLPRNHHFVPVDFEAGISWKQKLLEAGFDNSRPAVISCTGVTLYLTREAVEAALWEAAGFAPGSVLAMTFILPADMIDPEDMPMQRRSAQGAQSGGTPFVSFFTPDDMRNMAEDAGFKTAKIISGRDLGTLYFKDRTDGLQPSNSEQFLVAGT
ncbi:SAM-dependent methyltransferase [Chitinophaga parva]|uniref:S-adenosyl-L-methionine-dependent methyltransferase n=1 Tax=Chitinophaga parva TaxID=2169414 RepID=A0A2T7BEE8_9BACT|nr:class I SAM-dependent methyltransferase [Chitinophaga parva]PUZ23452.1 SAM-dependent methyltransferase [Chitinophaga parva]